MQATELLQSFIKDKEALWHIGTWELLLRRKKERSSGEGGARTPHTLLQCSGEGGPGNA